MASNSFGLREQSSVMPATVQGYSTPDPTDLSSAETALSHPVQGRKRNYPDTILRDSDWEPLKTRIIQLYINENMTIPSMQAILEEEFGFKATKRQFLSRIRKWDLDKNNKPAESKFMVQKQHYRRTHESEKPDYKFRVRGKPQSPRKYERWEARMDAKNVVFSPGAPETPGGISYWTGSPGSTACTPKPRAGDAPTPQTDPTTPRLQQLSGDTQLPDATIPNIDSNSAPPERSPTPWNNDPHELSTNTSVTDSQTSATTVTYRQDEEESLRQEIFELEHIHGEASPPVLDKMRQLFWILVGQCRYQPAEELGRQRIEAHFTSEAAQRGVKHALVDMAYLFQITGNLEKAEQAALQANQVSAGRDEDESIYIQSLYILAIVYRLTGRFEEADKFLRECLGRIDAGVKNGQQVPDQICSLILANLGDVAWRLGKLDEAEKWATRAVEMESCTLTRDALANILRFKGRWREAEKICLENIAELEAMFGEDDHRLVDCLNTLGLTYSKLGEWAKSEACFDKSLGLIIKLFGDGHPDVAQVMGYKCEMYMEQGMWEKAQQTLNERPCRYAGKNNAVVFCIYLTLLEAELLNGAGRFDQAREKMQHVSTYMTMENRPLVAMRVNDIKVTALRETGNLEEAEELARQNVEYSRQLVGQGHPDTLRYLGNFARTLLVRGKIFEGVRLMEECVFELGRWPGAGHGHYLTERAVAELKGAEGAVLVDLITGISS